MSPWGSIPDLIDPATAERLTAAAIARFGRLDGCLISAGGPPAGGIQNNLKKKNGVRPLVRLSARCAWLCGGRRRDGSESGGLPVSADQSFSCCPPRPGCCCRGWRSPTPCGQGSHPWSRNFCRLVRAPRYCVNGILPVASPPIGYLHRCPQRQSRTHRVKNEANIPLGRYGEPEEFASVAAFLLSPLSSYVTGFTHRG